VGDADCRLFRVRQYVDALLTELEGDCGGQYRHN
jgi:hypothetical protein